MSQSHEKCRQLAIAHFSFCVCFIFWRAPDEMQTPQTFSRRQLPFPKTLDTPFHVEIATEANSEDAATSQQSDYRETFNLREDPRNFLSFCESELRFGFFSALSGLEFAKKCAVEEFSAANQIRFILNEVQAQLDAKLEIISQLIKDRSMHPVYREPLQRLAKLLQTERDTWYLLDLVTAATPSDSLTTFLKPPVHLYDNQQLAMTKSRCILEWCEKVFMERSFGVRQRDDCVRKVEQKLAPLNDPAYGWSHTSSMEGKVKLDPDYPFRKHELHQTDRHADNLVCEQVFVLFRAGLLDQAIFVTEKVEQTWRGVCLLGFFGAWNGASNGEMGQTWNLWKLAAKEIAASPLTNIFERSVFSALCGVPFGALPVCQTWEDQVWIYFFCQVLKYWEELVSNQVVSSHSDEHILSIFEQCKEIDRDGVESDVMRRVQSFLGLGLDCSLALAQKLLQFLLSCQNAHRDWSWFLRFSAHVAILMRLSRGNLEDDLLRQYSEHILLAYCQHLLHLYLSDEMQAAEQGLTRSKISYDEMLMVYFSYLLDESDLIHCCVEYMVSALKADTRTEQVRMEQKTLPFSQRHSDERRTSCLEKIGQYLASFPRSTLNKIVETAVAYVWNHSSLGEESEGTGIFDSDLFLVRSVDFLIFPAYQNYHLAVACVNLFVRKFILFGKVQSAQNALDEISEDVLTQVEQEQSLWSSSHEFRCWQQFFRVWNAILEWRNYSLSQRPASLPSNILDMVNRKDDNISTEEQLWARQVLENYEMEWKEYRERCRSLGHALSEEIVSTLTMEGGWLLDAFPSRPPSSVVLNIFDSVERENELQQIRQQYIPLMIVQLVDVYKQMGEFQSCVELVQLVADDSFQLLSDLKREKLEPLLEQIFQVYLEYCDERAQCTTFPFVGEMFEAL